MSLMPEVALDHRLAEVADRRGQHGHRADDRADPPVAVEQPDHRADPGADTGQRRAGEALPGLLRADRRRHRVLAEQHAGHIAADIAGHHDQEERHHPLRARRPPAGPAGSRTRPAAGRTPSRKTPAVTSRTNPIEPLGIRQKIVASTVSASADQQRHRSAEVRGDQHRRRTGEQRDPRTSSHRWSRSTRISLVDGHQDGGQHDEDEQHLLPEQRPDDHRTEADTDRRSRRAGCARRGWARACSRRPSHLEQFGFLVLEQLVDRVDVLLRHPVEPLLSTLALVLARFAVLDRLVDRVLGVPADACGPRSWRPRPWSWRP